MIPTNDARELPPRVLIVDDERNNRQLLKVMLAPEGFVLSTAASGEEALASVERDPPDLILLDVMMPGTDGFQVTERLKKDPVTRNIPIVIVTALDDRASRMRGLTAGAEDFVTKPVDRAELCMRVRNLLRLKAYADHHQKYTQMLEAEVAWRTADLGQSERLYRSTFDDAPIGIVHVGLDGRWLRVNHRVCDKLGYSPEELQGAPLDGAVMSQIAVDPTSPDDSAALGAMAEGQMDRHVVDERRYRCKDGTLLWTRVFMSLHRNAEGGPQHFIWVIEDITERRSLEAQVQQAGKLDAIGGLAAGVAHDFNNLLSVVLSYCDLLSEGLKEGDPMRADLHEIRAAGQRAVDLTRQLLAFGRRQVLQPKVVDLAEIVKGMEKMLRRLLGEDVSLTATVAAPLGKVLVDPGQVEQVVMNLAINARDAMPRGGKLAIEAAEVCLDEAYASQHVGVKAGRHVMLTVTDSGTGMDDETLARIFEPFFTTKEPGRGTGLGLATVFGIVSQSGGTIRVDSEVGRGTTFKVFFPIADGEQTARPACSPAPVQTLRGSETILVVEDEETVRVLVRAILRKHGYDVLEAQSGGDAFLLCEEHKAPIHLLLTDVVMPRMSGRQLAERLLLVRPAMKVLYMSGYTEDTVVRHGIYNSSVGFIQKPFTPDAVARKVREVLDSRDTS